MNPQKNARRRSKMMFLTAAALLVAGGVFYAFQSSSPLTHALSIEWIDNSFPEKIDEEPNPNPTAETQSWTILPFGYTLGPWPNFFQGEPIVTKLTYQKGPPKKFIQTLIQVWRPVEVELSIEGPRTLDTKLTANEWKKCFGSQFLCRSDKKKFLSYAYPDLLKNPKTPITITWFESLDPMAAKGVHFHLDAESYSIDRYTVITDRGALQNFSLKYVKNEVGEQAKALFTKIMGGMKVKDELSGSRIWIQNKIQSVQLNQIRAISDPKLRMLKLIQVQNWIFSLLSVDPTLIAPFFHLAGVSHMLAMDLLKSKTRQFESQEAWILNSKPLLETLIKYANDFPTGPESQQAIKNMEALLQDFLLTQERMTGMKR
jgi:hypothetical protein